MNTEIRMRYGCNPHQAAARAYLADGHDLPIEPLNDAPSYINLMDALNAWQLVSELKAALGLPAATSFKHVSPAGAAVAVPLDEALSESYFVTGRALSPLATAYARARGADRLASFGDWIALSDEVDRETADLIRIEVSDGIIAPGYTPEALEILKKKKGGQYRILRIDPTYSPPATERRQIFGIELEQGRNDFTPDEAFFNNVVTTRQDLSAAARRDLTVATIALKYTQSNSVCLARDGQIIGVGAGQQSRVHCVRLACSKADNWYLRLHPRVREMRFARGLKRPEKINAIDIYLQDDITPAERKAWQGNFDQPPESLESDEQRAWLDQLDQVALSSDAFFPFSDNIDRAAQSGVEYLVQAGGSARAAQVVAAADEYGMLMINSGVRLFHH